VSALEFIARLVDSLAWPGAVVIVVIALREQIRRLLGDQVSRVKAGPIEVEWDRTLAEAKERVPAGEVSAGEAGDVVGDLFDLAETSPAAAVFEGYKRVEDALTRRIAAVYDGDLSASDASELARLARDLGIITGETVRAIDGLEVLRNLAAHSESGRVMREEAGEYLSLVQAVLFTIATWLKPDNPDSF